MHIGATLCLLRQRHASEGFEEVRARVPKGEKEPIKAHAQARGDSLNGFIVRAISETIERDNATPTASSELKES